MEPMAPCSLRDGLVSPAESRYNAQDGLADNDFSFLSHRGLAAEGRACGGGRECGRPASASRPRP